VVAAASDLGACVCEDDATVSELDDLRARVAELEAEREAERRREPSDEGGPGHEEQFWMRVKTRAAITHLRDMEDYFRLRGGLPEGFNMVRADRLRQLHEAITADFLNGKLTAPTTRDRIEAAEARVRVQAEQIAALQDALRQVLDCRGSYNGTVSMYGGDPAICTKCEAVARIALALAEGCAAPADEERE
jgi:hypothetical protein